MSAQNHGSLVSECAQLLCTNLGRQLYHGNSIEILNNGSEIFPAMMAAIDAAEEAIEFQTYVYWQGEVAQQFAECLASAAKRGVKVRVLLDSFGALTIDKISLKLIEENCTLCWFRPLKTIQIWKNIKRSHRKLLICDRKVGFTGGVGIAEQWAGNGDKKNNWRDSHFKIKGPVISTLRAAFLEGWLESSESCEILDEKPKIAEQEEQGSEKVAALASTASDFWSSTGMMLLSCIALSSKSLKIVTPYFVLDRKLRKQLIAAFDRGVDVQIIIPSFTNTDSHLAGLAAINSLPKILKAGIRVYAFEPTFIHNKSIVIDDEVAVIGSANFNQRSQRKDEEFSLIIDKGDTVEELINIFGQDLKKSTQLSLNLIKKRHKYLGYVARLIDPIRRHI